jgi:hypothetical protein
MLPANYELVACPNWRAEACISQYNRKFIRGLRFTMAQKQISFCSTTFNRLWQLEKTLEINLRALDDNQELVLADFGTDGTSAWVWENHSSAIKSKKLVFFEVKSPVSWHVAKAKNLAHRLSSGEYLFSLDGDNFIDSQDINAIKKASELGKPIHQWSGSWSDGSAGRIGLPRHLFFDIGGYDEAFLPMGGDDVDLIRRLFLKQIQVMRTAGPSMPAIQNTTLQKVHGFYQGDKAHAAWSRVNAFNLELSKLKNEIEGPCRVGGYATFRGTLNGKAVRIDGLGALTAEPIE